MEKQKESKNEPTLKDKVETIYEILSQHKIDIEYLGSKIEDMSIIHFQRYEGPYLGKVGPMPMENFPPEYRVGNSCNFILRRN